MTPDCQEDWSTVAWRLKKYIKLEGKLKYLMTEPYWENKDWIIRTYHWVYSLIHGYFDLICEKTSSFSTLDEYGEAFNHHVYVVKHSIIMWWSIQSSCGEAFNHHVVKHSCMKCVILLYFMKSKKNYKLDCHRPPSSWQDEYNKETNSVPFY